MDIASLFPPVTSATIEEKNVLHTTTDVNPIRDRITLSFFMLEGAHFSVRVESSQTISNCYQGILYQRGKQIQNME